MSSALPLPFFSPPEPELPAVQTVAPQVEDDTDETRQRLAEARRREAARLARSRAATRATGASGLSDTAPVAKKTLG